MKVYVVTRFKFGDCCSSDSTVVDSVYASAEAASIREKEIDKSVDWDYGDVEEMEVQ